MMEKKMKINKKYRETLRSKGRKKEKKNELNSKEMIEKKMRIRKEECRESLC